MNNYPNSPINTGYANQNQNQMLAAQGYPDQPPVQTRLSGIAARQESLNGELDAIFQRLDRLADRLCGSQPKEAPKPETGLRATISGLANVIDGHQEFTGVLVNRLRTALERLETL